MLLVLKERGDCHMEWLTVVSVIGGIVSPIIVAVIAARSEITAKNNKKLQDLEKKEKEREKEEQQRKFDELGKSIGEISSELKSISAELHSLSEQNEAQDSSIRSLNKMTRINGQYIHELAQLVTVLSEGMRDQHLDGNITKAINNYRKFETRALSHLLTGADDDEI